MNDVNKTENARMEKQRGDAALDEAMILLNSGKFDGAVSRAYYASFHYASAALFSMGLEAKSHRGMQRLFHLHFIRTKIFEEEIGIILSHAQKAHEEADYFSEITFSKKVAEERINEAKKLVETIRNYLQKIGAI